MSLSFNGEVFSDIADSNFSHRLTTLAKLKEGIVAISGHQSENKVELFSNGNWLLQPDFPEKEAFWYFSTVTIDNIVFIFGKDYVPSKYSSMIK